MNPRQVQLVKPIFLPRLTGIILLWMLLCPGIKTDAATPTPGWKNVRIIGGSGNLTIPKIEISNTSNDVYIASPIFVGEIEGMSVSSREWISMLAIYDSNWNRLSTQLLPKASTAINRLPYNVLAALDDGSILFGTMDDVPSSPLILQKFIGNYGGNLFNETISGFAIGELPNHFTKALASAGDGFTLLGSFSALQVGSKSFESLQSALPDVFILSFDRQGRTRWIENVMGASMENAVAGCRDPRDQSVYVGGHTTSPQLALGKVILNNPELVELPYIAKYATSGVLEWIVSPRSNSIARILALDTTQKGEVIFLARGAPESHNGLADILIGKYSRQGEIEWVKSAGKAPMNNPLHGTLPSMKTDASGRIYVSYNFSEPTVIDGVSYYSNGRMDMLIVLFDTEGAPIWIKTAGFIGDDYVTDMTISKDGRVYIAGHVDKKAWFDEMLIAGAYSQSIFLAELQSEFSGLPQITVEPLPQTIPTGKSVTFEVVTSKQSSYQWFFNGTVIAGATNSTLLISSVTAADQGTYFVEIKNIYGTVRSKAAQLRIDGQVEVLVTTYAGGHGPGYVDSTNPQLVQFYRPNGLAYLSQGLIAVADEFNQVIRLVGPGGTTDTYAGNHEAGVVDAPAGLASFRSPIGLSVTPSLDVLVADFNNDRIRRISAFGWRSVTTAAGNQRGYLDGDSVDAQLNAPNDLVTDTAGNIYFTEFNNHTVRKLGADGRVTTFAGNGFRGQSDGIGTQAQFDHPGGIAIDRDGNLYVTEYSGLRVRKITRGGQVTTIAGSGVRGFLDGKGTNAQFNAPDGICLDPAGNLYVCEGGNHAIRKIDPQGNVVTLAGLGKVGFQDGNASRALFNSPGGLMWHPAGGLVVADTENHALRRITFSDPPDNPEEAELLISLNPTLTVFGKAGATYRIEASEDPTVATDWVTLDTITLTNGVGMWCDSQPATRKWRYYRAVKTPNP